MASVNKVISLVGNLWRDPVTGCWNWSGQTRQNGYCRTTFYRKNWYVHRMSYSVGEKHSRCVPNGVRQHNAKLTDEKVIEIREKFGISASGKQLASMFNVDKSLIYLVVNRKIWRYI